MSNKHTTWHQLLWPLVIPTSIWAFIFIYSGILHAGFNYFVDDHWILRSHRDYTSLNDIFVQPFTSLFSQQQYRFRPLYDVFVRLFSQLYGLHPLIWYLSSFLVAISTTGVLYLVGRLQNFSVGESLGFASLVVFGQQASTYSRHGTPETTATLLVALALFFASLNIANRKIQSLVNFLFALFALLSALNKEACILFLPGLSLFKLWVSSQKSGLFFRASLAKNRNNIIFLVTVFSLCLAYIKLAQIGGTGYAGIDRDTLSIGHLIGSLTANGVIFGLAIASNITYAVIYFRDRENTQRLESGGFYIVIAMMIIPQLILYNKTQMVWHYSLPAAIGVSLLTFEAIKKIRSRSKIVAQRLMMICTIVICLQVIFTANYFQEVAIRVSRIQSMVADISNCVGQTDPLVIAGNPYTNLEMLESFQIVSSEILKNDRVFLATYGSQKSHLKIDIMQEEEKPWYFLDPEYIHKKYIHRTIDSLDLPSRSKIKGIVLANAKKVEPKFAELKLDWFVLERLNKRYYPELDLSVYCQSN